MREICATTRNTTLRVGRVSFTLVACRILDTWDLPATLVVAYTPLVLSAKGCSVETGVGKDLTGAENSTRVLPMIPFWRKRDEIPLELKVDINPSYEWAEQAKDLGVSHRELEVLALVVEGRKNKEIGEVLGIQHQSVKNHLQHLFKKLKVKNNTQAYIATVHLNMMRLREPREQGQPQAASDTSGEIA